MSKCIKFDGNLANFTNPAHIILNPSVPRREWWKTIMSSMLTPQSLYTNGSQRSQSIKIYLVKFGSYPKKPIHLTPGLLWVYIIALELAELVHFSHQMAT